MGVLLEIKTGPFAGKQITLATGKSIVIGRAPTRAEFAVPHDTFMSGVHFVVECGLQGCRVVDKKSSNGTFLNGARVQEATVANGDEIRSGQTVFSVKMVADDKLSTVDRPPSAVQPHERPGPAAATPPRPSASVSSAPVGAPATPPSVRPAMRTADQGREAGRINAAAAPVPPSARSAPVPASASAYGTPLQAGAPPQAPMRKSIAPAVPAAAGKLREAALSVMGWSFFAIPEKWEVQEGFGMQQAVKDEFPSSVVATQESLGGVSLQQFVEAQISMLRQYLHEPKIEPAMPPHVGGAEESVAVDVRHTTKDGKEIVYRRIYARSGPSVGVLTVTTLAENLPQVLQSLQPVLDTAAFRSTAGT